MAATDDAKATLSDLDNEFAPTLRSVLKLGPKGSGNEDSVNSSGSVSEPETDEALPELQSPARTVSGSSHKGNEQISEVGKKYLTERLPLGQSSAGLDGSWYPVAGNLIEQTRGLDPERVQQCANTEGLPEHRRANLELLAEVFQGGNPVDDGLLDYIMLRLDVQDQDRVFTAIKDKHIGRSGLASTNTEGGTHSTAAVVEEIRTHVSDMKAEVNKVREHCGSLSTAVAGIRKDVLQWDDKHDELVEDVCVLTSCIVDAKKEMSVLKGAVNGFTSHVAFLERAIAGLAIHNTTFNDAAAEFGAQVASLKGVMNDLLTVSTTMKGDVTGLKFAVTNLESDVAALTRTSERERHQSE